MRSSVAILALATLAVTQLTACGSAPQKAQVADNTPDWQGSSIQIHYVLGHSKHQIQMQADGSQFVAQCSRDDKKLKQSKIDASHYGSFFSQTSEFVNHQLAAAASTASGTPVRAPADCASPYTIEIKKQNNIQKLDGCRVLDQGAFARLVKDAEFLIYSQK